LLYLPILFSGTCLQNNYQLLNSDAVAAIPELIVDYKQHTTISRDAGILPAFRD